MANAISERVIGGDLAPARRPKSGEAQCGPQGSWSFAGKTAKLRTIEFLDTTGTTPLANLLTGLRADEIFRRAAGAGAEDFLTDALGNTIALADANGSVQTAYAYEPYGVSSATGTASGNTFQYMGRENDGGLSKLSMRSWSRHAPSYFHTARATRRLF